jgi:hypothetical protein
MGNYGERVFALGIYASNRLSDFFNKQLHAMQSQAAPHSDDKSPPFHPLVNPVLGPPGDPALPPVACQR